MLASTSSDSLVILPILVDSHWAVIDVSRSHDAIQIKLTGFSPSFIPRIKAIASCLLEPPLAPVTFVEVPFPTIMNMCGWQHLFTWFRQANLRSLIPDTSATYLSLDQACQTLIDDVLQDAIHGWTSADAPIALIQFASSLRKNFFVNLARHGAAQSIMTGPLYARVPSTVAHSSQSAPSTTEQPLSSRLLAFNDSPGWLFSDELDFLLDRVRIAAPTTYFPPPAKWCGLSQSLIGLHGLVNVQLHTPATCWFVLFGSHWTQIDIVHTDALTMLVHSQFASDSPEINGLALYIAGQLGLPAQSIQRQAMHCNTEPNMCGWRLLHRTYARFGLSFPQNLSFCHSVFANSSVAATVFDGLALAIQTWTTSSTDKILVAFAHHGRLLFLLRLLEGRLVTNYHAGGAKDSKNGDVDMQGAPSGQGSTSTQPTTAKKVDPLWENDPWSSKRGKPTQTRWEDLILPSDHPFRTDEDRPLVQTHRLQAAHLKQGIALVTKSNLQELLAISSSSSFGLLVPNTDLSQFGTATCNAAGPYEVILHDPNLGTSYKRLVKLITVAGKIEYSLPKSTHKFTSAEFVEIVLELDSRLLVQKDFENAAEHPVQAFKKLLQAALANDASNVSIYGFRQGKHPSATKSDAQLQCIMQIAKDKRKQTLEFSGSHALLTRDYLEKGASSSDVTVLPRFWDPNPKGLAEAATVAKQVSGVAGIVLTRRGLAVRCWTDQIATVRKTVLAGDCRLTNDNLAVVPRHVYDSTGWPAAMEPKHVVSSVLQATQLPPVPMRAFRNNGVHGWSLAFATQPTIVNFVVEINGKSHQILLAEPKPSLFNRQAKAQSKPTKSSKQTQRSSNFEKSPPQPIVFPTVHRSAEEERIAKLEDRMDKMDCRQSRIENKLDTRFDEVGSMLRQLLTSQSSRDRDSTGETPPPKHPKHT